MVSNNAYRVNDMANIFLFFYKMKSYAVSSYFHVQTSVAVSYWRRQTDTADFRDFRDTAERERVSELVRVLSCGV